MVVAEVVVGNVQEPAPPLHDMAARLRTELGLPEMPMYKLIERAASELGIEHETKAGATLIEKAEAAWKALLGGGGK